MIVGWKVTCTCLTGCVLRPASCACVLRPACCVLRAASCVLRSVEEGSAVVGRICIQVLSSGGKFVCRAHAAVEMRELESGQ